MAAPCDQLLSSIRGGTGLAPSRKQHDALVSASRPKALAKPLSARLGSEGVGFARWEREVRLPGRFHGREAGGLRVVGLIGFLQGFHSGSGGG
jgi:hypothetical protein